MPVSAIGHLFGYFAKSASFSVSVIPKPKASVGEWQNKNDKGRDWGRERRD